MATISKADLRAISEAATARAVGRLKVEQAVEALDPADVFELFATSQAARLGSNLAATAPTPGRPDTALAELTETDLDVEVAGLVNGVQEAAGRSQSPRSAAAVPASKSHAQAELAEAWLTQLGVPKAGEQPVTETADPKVKAMLEDYYTRYVA